VTGDGCRPAAKRAPPRTSLMQPPFSQTLGAGGHVTYPSQRHSSLEYSQRPCNKPARREPGWRCCRHAARSPRHLISHNQDTNHYNFTREQNRQSTIEIAADPIWLRPSIQSSSSAHRSSSHAAHSLSILLIPVAAPAYRRGFLQALDSWRSLSSCERAFVWGIPNPSQPSKFQPRSDNH
jgi:hypothetical protein